LRAKNFNVKLKINREYMGITYSIEADLDSLKERDIGKILEEAEKLIDQILNQDEDEISNLDEIAVNELKHGRHGSFLEHFLLAWQYADPSNKRILKPAFKHLINKYSLSANVGSENESSSSSC